MKKRNLSKKIITISIVSAAILAFAYHIRYSEEPVSMEELISTSIVAPCAANNDFKLAIKKAAAHNVSYIDQLLLYKQYRDTNVYNITKNRVWNALVAVLVVFLIFRVGSMCVCRLTGVLSAFVFALMPPSIWNNYSLQILIVLLHFELLVFAFKKNNVLLWVAWAIVSVLLFGTGIYAEPILLQSWFITLLAGIILWIIFAKYLPVTTSEDQTHHNSHGRRSIWKKISEDSGLSRFVVLMGVLIVTILVFSVIAGSFVPLFMNPLMLIISIGSVCTIIFMLPNFTRERQILIKWYRKRKSLKLLFSPAETFIPLNGSNRLLNLCFAYSGAILSFLPFLYFCHREINVFIDNWEVGNLISYISETGNIYNWLFLFLPVVFIIVNLAGYLLRIISRGRLIGVSIIFLLSCVYVFQQRYAVLSTPFYVLCVAGLASSIIKLSLKMFKIKETA